MDILNKLKGKKVDSIDELYNYKAEDLATISKEDKDNFKRLDINYSKVYNTVIGAIDNIPTMFVETKKEINKTIQNLLEEKNKETSYYVEKYYKTRIC